MKPIILLKLKITGNFTALVEMSVFKKTIGISRVAKIENK